MIEPMHETHDLDLLTALVEGGLDDPAPAEALVRSCPECARIVSDHQLVRSRVQVEPVVALTELERRRLHSNVWSALEEQSPATSGSSPRTAKGTPWWYRVAPVAAALVVVVGIMSLNPGETSSTTMLTQLDAPPADAFRPAAGGSNEAEEFAATVPTGDATATTAAAADTTAGAAIAGAPDLEILADEASAFERRAASMPGDLPEAAAECVVAEAPEEDPVAAVRVSVADTEVWMVAFGQASDIAEVRVYDVDTCELLYPIE